MRHTPLGAREHRAVWGAKKPSVREPPMPYPTQNTSTRRAPRHGRHHNLRGPGRNAAPPENNLPQPGLGHVFRAEAQVAPPRLRRARDAVVVREGRLWVSCEYRSWPYSVVVAAFQVEGLAELLAVGRIVRRMSWGGVGRFW